jgi:succinate dehydrogenase/fumarate reductase flavoprotein subunit
MEKIPAVETAKALMNEAVSWSVMKWLRDKKTVRKIADEANAALDQLNQAVKDRWPDDIRAAYKELLQPATANTKLLRRGESILPTRNTQAIVAKKVQEADDEAHRARMDAEEIFDKAEKQLSTALAREGCRRAIRCWELHERAIRKAEALISSHESTFSRQQ